MDKLLRLIDANLNRSQEGLRVCEDISRFILNDKKASGAFKSLRHKTGELARRIYRIKPVCLKSRNVKRDIGKKTTPREGRRKNLGELFRANIQRVKESLRVLEEATKLLDRKIPEHFKVIRFRVYELEKRTRLKLEAILHR